MRDSNPRNGQAVHRISSPAQSVTLATLLESGCKIRYFYLNSQKFSLFYNFLSLSSRFLAPKPAISCPKARDFFPLVSRLLCPRLTTSLPSAHDFFALGLPIVTQLLDNRHTVVAQLSHSCCTIVTQLLHNRLTAVAQSAHSRLLISTRPCAKFWNLMNKEIALGLFAYNPRANDFYLLCIASFCRLLCSITPLTKRGGAGGEAFT